jgi:hypothetical protein
MAREGAGGFLARGFLARGIIGHVQEGVDRVEGEGGFAYVG